MHVNPKLVIAEWETHPYHRQENTDGAECSLDWCDTGYFLREIEGLDGHIQRRDSTVPPVLSRGLRNHSRGSWERTVWQVGWEKDLIQVGGHFVMRHHANSRDGSIRAMDRRSHASRDYIDSDVLCIARDCLLNHSPVVHATIEERCQRVSTVGFAWPAWGGEG